LPPGDIPESYNQTLVHLFISFMQQLGTQIPLEANLAEAYNEGSDDDCVFFHRLALLLSTFLMNFVHLFVQTDGTLLHYDTVVVPAYLYMIRLSEIEDEEIFKTCLELWYQFTKELYTASVANTPRMASGAGFGLSSVNMQSFAPNAIQSRVMLQRLQALEPVLHLLRVVIIDHMAKPEEVIIVEDDNGEIIREHTKDTEVIAQYKTMREAIVYLAHLNYDDTETIMLQKLELQVTGGQFSWNGLNTLCWAMGSISGAMSEMDEKRFLVSIIKDLLKLCEDQRGKDNKAVVASNIMYIVGQYPRFLRAHWKFLKTVVNKLFEFMHELHPGVQDMACDTFLKIAQKCKRKFMTPQLEDPEPFILTLIADLERHTHDLQPHQVLAFYEAVGTILSDNGPSIRLPRDIVILRLMDSVNNNWTTIISEGARDPNTLFTMDAIKEITRIMKINTKVCSSAGSVFVHQLSLIFMDTLKVYKLYSEQINAACAAQGQYATRLMLYKAMKGVKSDILDLLTSFMECARDLEGGPQSVVPVMLPPMMSDILGDYRAAPPPARDARVLSLFSTIITVLKESVASELPNVLDAVFQPTLEMITTNMQDYPDLRINFFKFLREANQHCFYGLFNVPQHLQKLIVDSVVWAFRHTERNISETGLEILEELLKNISVSPTIAQPFYQSFLLPLIQDVMVIMTDRLHKSGFKSQAAVLMHIFHLVEKGGVTVPLFDPNTLPPGAPMPVSNSQFLKEHVANLLIGAFPNLTQSQVITFVVGLFDVTKDINMFKQLLRDFLITVKEFASEDNSDLYLEETEASLEQSKQQQRLYRQSVPGLLNPDEVELGDLDYDDDA
jgi:exportin-1